MNNWFNDVFLASFTECHNKRISEKQYQVFERNLKKRVENIEYSNGFKDVYEYGDKIIVLENYGTIYGTRECYLTIK